MQFASANYMVQDLCFFLQKLGVKIEGIGTSTLRISGVKEIKKNVTYAPSEDPIEAMFFTSAAVTTNSEITIKRVPIDFMALELLKLRKWASIRETERYKADNGKTDLVDLTIHKHDGKLLALTEKIHANVYPGLNQDNLPYFVPIAAVARGRTLIHDWTYENRAMILHRDDQSRRQRRAGRPAPRLRHGPTKFSAADVVCPAGTPPGFLLLIGMLAAPGTQHAAQRLHHQPRLRRPGRTPELTRAQSDRSPSCTRGH
jgi:UDP-N-acetylglucosamine 1-carboxyvinyltransferase